MIVELCTPHAPPPRGKRWVMDTILHQQDPLLLGEHSYADRGGTITMLSRTDWDPSTALRDSVCADTTIAEHHNSIERADVQFYFPVLPNKKYTNMDEQTQTPKQDQHRPGIHKCVEPNTVRSVCVFVYRYTELRAHHAALGVERNSTPLRCNYDVASVVCLCDCRIDDEDNTGGCSSSSTTPSLVWHGIHATEQ